MCTRTSAPEAARWLPDGKMTAEFIRMEQNVTRVVRPGAHAVLERRTNTP